MNSIRKMLMKCAGVRMACIFLSRKIWTRWSRFYRRAKEHEQH